MNSKDIISFVVPVYNCEKYLQECVRSLQRQEGNIEIILIDDASTDNSGPMCDELANSDNRINVVHKLHGGVSAARNAGITAATGKWISFVDADDLISADFCSVLRKYIDETIDIVFVNTLNFHNNKPTNKLLGDFEYEKLSKEQLELFQRGVLNKYALKEKPHLTSACAKIYRKEMIQKFHLFFDTELSKSEDALYNNYAYYYAKNAIWIKKEMYFYRQHDSSVTHRYDELILETYLQHIKKLQQFCIDTNQKLFDTNDMYVRIVFDFMYCIVNCFCNKENPREYELRKKDFLTSLDNPIFIKAFNLVKMDSFSLHEKILCFCIKYKMFLFIDILYKMYTKLK